MFFLLPVSGIGQTVDLSYFDNKMKRDKAILNILLFSVLVWSACSSSRTSQSGRTIFFVKPVYLLLGKEDTNKIIRSLFEKAFALRNVKLVSQQEFSLINEAEIKRAGARAKALKEAGNLNSVKDWERVMAREHRYVTNMLSINLKIEVRNDSNMIYRASWNYTPFPPDFFGSPYVSMKPKEIYLTNLSYSLKENIYSIVDSILYSKELK